MQKLFDEVTCPQCEKTFICWDRGAWKYRKTIKGIPRFFCTWSCIKKYNEEVAERESRRREEARLRRRKEKTSVQQMQEVREEADGS